MHIVLVSIHVRAQTIDEFLAATRDNVRESLQEKGVARFDVLRHAEDPNRFLLVEVYRQAQDQVLHKETAHYKRWAAAVEPLLAEPRTRIVYQSAFPQESGWEQEADAI